MKDSKKWLAQKSNQWVVFLLLGGLIFRTLMAIWMHPGFDEAYYYLYALHLNWSYFDHPPLVALTTGLGMWLTGEVNQFTMRIGTLIVYTGSLIFLYLTGAKLFAPKVGFLALAIASFVPFFQAGFGILNLPDCPLMFFWSAALYVAASEFFGRSDRYQPSYRLAIIAFMVGCACLGKYHGFLLGLGLVCFCLFSPQHRRALTSRWCLAGIGLFLLSLAPVLWWNWQHDWISFRFQSMRAVPGNSFDLWGAFGVFLVSIGYLFPTLGLPMWWASARALMVQADTKVKNTDLRQKYLFLLWVSAPIILIFTLMGAYRQVLPNWPMPGYWAATLLLAERAAMWQARSPQKVRRWLWGSAIAMTFLATLALSHVTFGIGSKLGNIPALSGLLAPENDTSSQLIDIQQLRQGFARSPALNTALNEAKFVFTHRFFIGGQVAMALTPISGKPVTTFDVDPRGFAYWYDQKQWLGQNALYVTSEYFQKGENLMDKYGAYFSNIAKVGEIPIVRGGSVVQVFSVYQAKNFLKPYPLPYGTKYE